MFDTLNIKETYQEVVNNEGAVFFVESSDNHKFHIFDKTTQELIGKTFADSNTELTKNVEGIVTFV